MWILPETEVWGLEKRKSKYFSLGCVFYSLSQFLNRFVNWKVAFRNTSYERVCDCKPIPTTTTTHKCWIIFELFFFVRKKEQKKNSFKSIKIYELIRQLEIWKWMKILCNSEMNFLSNNNACYLINLSETSKWFASTSINKRNNLSSSFRIWWTNNQLHTNTSASKV